MYRNPAKFLRSRPNFILVLVVTLGGKLADLEGRQDFSLKWLKFFYREIQVKSPHNWGYILLSHLWTLTRIDQSVVRRHLSVLSLSIPLASGSESPILKASSSILANKCWIGLSLYSNFATPCRTALRIDSEEMISRHQPIFFFSKRNLEREGGDLFLLVVAQRLLTMIWKLRKELHRHWHIICVQ